LTPEEASILDEAQALHDVRWYCSSEALQDAMGDWIKELLGPLVKQDIARATWLYDAIDDWGDLSNAEYDRRHLERLKAGADAEIPDAMFYLGHHHYENGEHAQAAVLYRKAADTGYAYAKWCHGLDLMSGTGVAQDQAAGL